MDPINGHTVMCALSARATLSYEKPKWLMGCDICSTNVMIRYLGKHQERKTISAHILRSWSKKIWGIFILFNKHIFWQLFRTLLFHLFLQIPQQKVLCAAPLFPKGQPKRIDLHIWFGTDFMRMLLSRLCADTRSTLAWDPLRLEFVSPPDLEAGIILHVQQMCRFTDSQVERPLKFFTDFKLLTKTSFAPFHDKQTTISS